MTQTIATTREDFETLAAELDNIKKVQRPAILIDLNAARANGDLKENADYHAAKEKLQQLDSRIAFLEDRLGRSRIIDHDTAAADTVTFGAVVTVKNISNGKTMDFQLVDTASVDPAAGKISAESPVGKALMGSKRGEQVTVQTPRGTTLYEIIDYK